MVDQPVSRWGLMRRGYPWIAIIFLVIGLVLGAIMMSEARKADRLDSDGRMAVATITDKDIEVSRDSDGHENRTYYLYFSFPHPGGSFSGRDAVGRKFYRRLSIGSETQIRYWREDPSVNEIEPGSTARTILITKIIAALLLAGGTAWLTILWQRAGRAILVRETGVRREALVTEHFRTNVRVNGRPRYRLVWEDSEGGRGRSFMMHADRRDDYPVGALLVVYADPAGRLSSVWEGDVGPPAGMGAVRR